MANPLTRCLSFSRILPAHRISVPATPFTLFDYFCQNLQKRKYSTGKYQGQEVVADYSKTDEMTKEVISKVNDQIVKKTHGRLFAVVQIAGQQFKITTEDIIVVRNDWPPTIGDKIRLEKVLLVGSSDFTLIGRPLLPKDQVSVFATVIEKTYTHPYPVCRFKKRKNHRVLNFYKYMLTYLRITDILLRGKVNELGDTDGLSDRIF